MSVCGKGKSHKKSKYKREDEPTDNNKKMPHSFSFKHKLVSSASAAKPGDKLYSAKAVGVDEEIPFGSVGCFVPEGRSGTIEILMEKIDGLIADNVKIEAKNAEFEAQIQSLTKKFEINDALNQRKLAAEFDNDLVQLVYGLCHAKILAMVKDPKITKGKRNLRFDVVLRQVDALTKIKSI